MAVHIIRNLEWLNHNGQRNYPLVAAATAVSTDGGFRIPEDFLVSLYIFIPSSISVDASKFFVKTIRPEVSGYNLTVGYMSESGAVDVASAHISRTGFTPDKTFRLGGVKGSFYDVTGHLVIGRLTSIDQQPAGEFSFDLDGARLETDAIRPLLRSVTSVQIQNGSDLSAPLTGPVTLAAGDNCRIDLLYDEEGLPQIILNAIDGENLSEICVCPDANAPAPIRTINDIPGDALGNFELLDSDCMRLVPLQNGLRVENNCSRPCCDAPELVTITEAATQTGSKLTTLENFLLRLEVAVQQMHDAFLGSILSDGGCLDCEE